VLAVVVLQSEGICERAKVGRMRRGVGDGDSTAHCKSPCARVRRMALSAV
jgi:hypothetical protein